MAREQHLEDPSDELEQLDEAAPEAQYDDDDEPQPEPQLVRVRLNGKTLMVTEDVADAIQARESDYQRQISKMGTELGALRSQTQPRPERPTEPAADDDLEFFQSPTKAVEARVRQAEERAYQRIQAERAQEKAREQFWGAFYRDNKDLKDQQEVVEYIFARDSRELADYGIAEGQQEIARRVKTFLGMVPKGNPLPRGKAQAERAGNPAPQSRQRPEEPKPQKTLGLSDAIASRAERRRKALYEAKKD